MNEKFNDIPVDKNTIILFNEEMLFGEIACLFQVWYSGSIQGSSLILQADEVEGLSNDDLKRIITESKLLNDVDSSVTFSRIEGDKYVFVNFNFIAN